MFTLSNINSFLQSFQQSIPTKLQSLFLFGFSSISSLPLSSLNANARISSSNPKTGETKIFRLLHNNTLRTLFPYIISTSTFLAQSTEIVNIDFSDFKNGKQVLMFAKQSYQGRAIPLYYEVLRYPIQKGSQNIFIQNAIDHFLNIMGNNRTIMFVFDRGFAGKYLVQYLVERNLLFYLRIKRRKQVELTLGKRCASEKVYYTDQKVKVYGLPLRLVRSQKPHKNMQAWYILTNDFTRSKKKILKIYYHRFEIEELFKDAKRFFRLEYLRVKRIESFEIVLWFVIIGIWLSWYIEWCVERKVNKKGKYELSIVRIFFEKLEREWRLLLFEKLQW